MKKLNIFPIRDVLEFHKMGRLTIGDGSKPMSKKDAELRIRLIAEEMAETIHALTSKKWDDPRTLNEARLETLDGLCDIIYVSAGTSITMDAGVGLEAPLWFDQNGFKDFRKEKSKTIRNLSMAAQLPRLLNRLVSEIELNDCGAAYYMLEVINSTCAGIAYVLDLPIGAGFQEVQNANMSKRLKDGSIFHDKGGKLIKPPGFVPPNLKYVLKHGKPKKRPAYTKVKDEKELEKWAKTNKLRRIYPE